MLNSDSGSDYLDCNGVCQFEVSSKIITLVSPAFDKMIHGPFMEGQAPVNEGDPRIFRLPDDDPHIVSLFCIIVHHKETKRHLDLSWSNWHSFTKVDLRVNPTEHYKARQKRNNEKQKPGTKARQSNAIEDKLYHYHVCNVSCRDVASFRRHNETPRHAKKMEMGDADYHCDVSMSLAGFHTPEGIEEIRTATTSGAPPVVVSTGQMLPKPECGQNHYAVSIAAFLRTAHERLCSIYISTSRERSVVGHPRQVRSQVSRSKSAILSAAGNRRRRGRCDICPPSVHETIIWYDDTEAKAKTAQVSMEFADKPLIDGMCGEGLFMDNDKSDDTEAFTQKLEQELGDRVLFDHILERASRLFDQTTNDTHPLEVSQEDFAATPESRPTWAAPSATVEDKLEVEDVFHKNAGVVDNYTNDLFREKQLGSALMWLPDLDPNWREQDHAKRDPETLQKSAKRFYDELDETIWNPEHLVNLPKVKNMKIRDTKARVAKDTARNANSARRW
ncbi:hypothetical protein LTR44_003628 [Exophiala sp. CCFEE 6388]|nr:hypothetical protein LTR44_003628 [Eurotiomycetes sp. CCFEE 6388]